jgi:hypothetical protein
LSALPAIDVARPGGGARLGAEIFELTDGARAERFAYRDVAAMRLSYRPRSLDYHVFRLDLRMVDGRTVKLFNVSSSPGAAFKPHERWDEGYRTLAQSLVDRIGAQAPKARLEAGFAPARYWAAAAAGAVMLGVVGLRLAQALALGDARVALVSGAGLALIALFLKPFLSRNRPRPLKPGAVPPQVLP